MIQPLLFSSQPNPHLHPRVAALRSSSSRPRHGSQAIPEEDYSMGALFDYALKAIHQAMKNKPVREPRKLENVVMTVDVETVDVIPQNPDLFVPQLNKSDSDSSLQARSHDKSRSGGHSEFKRTQSRTSLASEDKPVSPPTGNVRKQRKKKKPMKFVQPNRERKLHGFKATYALDLSPDSTRADHFEATIKAILEEKDQKRRGSQLSDEFIFDT